MDTTMRFWHLSIWFSVVSGQLMLFMSEEETSRLLDIDAQTPYVINNRTMTKAASNQVVVEERYNTHILYWVNTDSSRQVEYSIDFTSDPPDGLEMPIKLNISTHGFVPNQLTAMAMTFNCTGRRRSILIDVRFNFTNWLGDNVVTSITLKRKKVCLSVATTQPYDVLVDNIVHRVSGSRTFGDDSLYVTEPGSYVPRNLPKPTSTEIFYVAVGVASGVIILVAVIIFTLYIRTKRQTMLTNDRPSVIGSSNHGSSFLRLDGNKNSSLVSSPSSRRGTLSSFSQPPSMQDVTVTLNSLAINRKSVTLGELVLEGAFGKVFHGVVFVQDESEECYDQKVLIKTTSDEASEEDTRCLLVEGSKLKGLNHQYINPLIAACLDTPALLIYPNSEKGNLKTLLKNSTRISEQFPCINTQQLVYMALQVAKGLHYLHRKHIIHRDVAARNCSVDSELNVKVSDCALSSDLFPDDYISVGSSDSNREMAPVKWMAIECLVAQRYTYATDTWSFGVLLWELITFAQQPYRDLDPSEMSNYLQSGFRLLQPSSCPDELFAVMAYCWAMHPSDRPSLTQILACLHEFHQTLSCFV